MKTATRLVVLALPAGSALLLPTAALAVPPPLAVEFSDVNCRTNQVTVTITNQGTKQTQYTVLKDGNRVDRGQPDTGETNKETVKVDPGDTAKVSVVSNNVVVKSEWVDNNCRGRGRGGGWGHRGWDNNNNRWDHNRWGDNRWDRGRLPFTGPPADLWGKLATAGGLMLTGGIVWWYGSIWPKQAYDGPITSGRKPRRRYPDLKI